MPIRLRISWPASASDTAGSASTSRISSSSRIRSVSLRARSTTRCASSCRARESAPASAWSRSCTKLVEHLDVGLGQRREQHRVAAVDVGALQRLVGGPAADLREHPSPPARQAGQVQPAGAVAAEELELVQLGLEYLWRGCGRATTEPGKASDSGIRVDVEEPVQLPRPRWDQQRCEPLVDLCPGAVARGRDATGESVDWRAYYRLRAQPVTGQLLTRATFLNAIVAKAWPGSQQFSGRIPGWPACLAVRSGIWSIQFVDETVAPTLSGIEPTSSRLARDRTDQVLVMQ